MNQRRTIQRSLVLETVRQLKRHVTADEVYEALSEQYPGIGRATVYRNLNLLADKGEIRKVEMPSGADCYDHLCHAHYHARCQKCGRIFDVDMAYMKDLEAHIKESHGFLFTGHDVIFKGVCQDCQR